MLFTFHLRKAKMKGKRYLRRVRPYAETRCHQLQSTNPLEHCNLRGKGAEVEVIDLYKLEQFTSGCRANERLDCVLNHGGHSNTNEEIQK